MTLAAPVSFGRHRVIRELGRGGEAIVYLAEDPQLGRLVAIKSFPLAIGAEDPGGHERSRREAEVLSRLDHPGISRILDSGVEDGIPFIVLSYVEGETLDCRSRVEPRDALRIAIEVARIVGAAHAAQVVHGDLKPQNVIVSANGACFVLDFGVARFLDEGLPSGSTRPSGTLPYLAPECLVQAPDQQSDVYGLGAVLFELVTGRPPHQAPTRAALLHQLLHEEAPLARSVKPDVGRDLEAVLAKALARSTGRRYPSMAAFASDLERVARGEPPSARRVGPAGLVARWARRRPAAAALAAFLVVFFAVAGAVTLVKNRRLGRYLERASLESGRSVAEARAAEAHLVRHARLADHRRLEDLERRARALVPPAPALVRELAAWEKSAESLAKGLDSHRHALAELRLRGTKAESTLGRGISPAARRRIADLRDRHARLLREVAESRPGDQSADEGRVAVTAEKNLGAFIRLLESALPRAQTWAYEDAADSWHDATLSAVVEGLERFAGEGGPMRDVSRRIEDARRLSDRLAADREAWERARRSIADRAMCPKYDGLVLAPQLGLTPLRQDPATGLWEFLHVLSGDAGAGTGDPRKPESCVTLVLVPGGRARIGARPPRQGERPGSGHLDAAASVTEAPVDDVPLAPFFISRYEMTRAQWQRCSGRSGGGEGGNDDPTLPVGDVDWNETASVLARVGLELPTEAQWEYAARCGTSTTYWTGPEAGSLSGAEWFAPELQSPVGRLRPNAFGLFDVAGNAAEWCRDVYSRYDFPRIAGSGERVTPDAPDVRVWRGGSHRWPAAGLRSAKRGGDSPNMKRPDLGVRPARAIDR